MYSFNGQSKLLEGLIQPSLRYCWSVLAGVALEGIVKYALIRTIHIYHV